MPQPDFLSLIGNTPLVELTRVRPRPGVRILAKVEYFNPGGSIKDRVAAAMIARAEQAGEIAPGKTVIEATSGNTGVGLAMVCAVKGYPIKLLMPDTASEERKRIMRAYGADIELTPGRLGTDGAIEEAYRLAREESDTYVLMDQFNNPASVEAHYNGTGLEIWEQTGGAVTHAVICLGTSGTAMGVAKRLHEMGDVRVVAVEPYAGHRIQGLKNMQESYPPGIFDRSVLDATIRVEDEEAFECARRLAREEGLLVGMSSGAALAGALKLAADLPEDQEAVIAIILPDGGERYLSTTLFAQKAEQGVSVTDLASGSPVFLDPGSGECGLYTVGPSLDAWDDADFWRRAVLLDALARYLESVNGAPGAVRIKVVAGLADLDDRALAAARGGNKRREALGSEVMEKMRAMAARLGLSERLKLFLAGGRREIMTGLCDKLLQRGLAYEKLRSVYFDVGRDAAYGASDLAMSTRRPERAAESDTYIKDNPEDFTLLKRATLRDVKEAECWQTRWGNVRPSWFVQMAAPALGDGPRPLAVMGGEAHRFPHLENLRAIWSGAGVAAPQAWLACRPVSVPEGCEADHCCLGLASLLEAGRAPGAARMWLLSRSYHKPLAYKAEALDMWTANRRKVLDAVSGLEVAAAGKSRTSGLGEDVEQWLVDVKTAFRDAVEDDMSFYKFWPALFGFCKQVSARLTPSRAGKGLNADEAGACLEQLRAVDAVLGVLDLDGGDGGDGEAKAEGEAVPAEVMELVEQREAARKARDFATADALRDQVKEMGYAIEDSPQGPRLHKED